MYYNFCRIHSTLRVTPGMEAVLSMGKWMIEDLVALMESMSILDGLKQITLIGVYNLTPHYTQIFRQRFVENRG
jgi:hypothetical protein